MPVLMTGCLCTILMHTCMSKGSPRRVPYDFYYVINIQPHTHKAMQNSTFVSRPRPPLFRPTVSAFIAMPATPLFWLIVWRKGSGSRVPRPQNVIMNNE